MKHPYIVESDDLPDIPWESIFGRPLCFIDIETNGTDESANIVEIALIRVAGGVPARMFRTLLWADSPGMSELHDIWESDLEKAPTFEQVVPVLRELSDGAILVAHYASFENRFLRREMEALGGSWQQPMLCTLKLSRALHPERKGRGAHTQAGLSELYGLDFGGPSHHALPDTVQLVVLVLAMVRANLENPGLEEAFAKAMLPQDGDDDTVWPVPPSTVWRPRGREESSEEELEPVPEAASQARPASYGKGLVVLALLGAVTAGLYALAFWFVG